MAEHRILILSSSTGGGHDMRADALSQWLNKLHDGKVLVERWQILEESSAIDRLGVWLYNQIQRFFPLAHHFYFNCLELLGLHRQLIGIRNKSKWRKKARAFQPDTIVSTHAHLNHGYFKLLKEALAPHSSRCLIYCGEMHGGYGFSRHWVNPKADAFIAAVPACAEAAEGAGMPKDRIHTSGFLLKPSFYEEEDKPPDLNTILGESLRGPVVLLGTGANGANNHRRVLRHLDAVPVPVNFIALCGHNQQAYQFLKSLDIAPHRVIPLEYQNNMAALLRAVDLAFIRPGSGTTSECIHCHCPVLFNGLGGVMPQERLTLLGVQRIGIEPVVLRRASQFGDVIGKVLCSEKRDPLNDQKRAFISFHPGGQPEDIVRKVIK